MRWADVYVCMLADGVALGNRCPQGQADPRAAIAGGASGVTMARAGPHPRRARHSGPRARGTDGTTNDRETSLTKRARTLRGALRPVSDRARREDPGRVHVPELAEKQPAEARQRGDAVAERRS